MFVCVKTDRCTPDKAVSVEVVGVSLWGGSVDDNNNDNADGRAALLSAPKNGSLVNSFNYQFRV